MDNDSIWRALGVDPDAATIHTFGQQIADDPTLRALVQSDVAVSWEMDPVSRKWSATLSGPHEAVDALVQRLWEGGLLADDWQES